MLRTLTPNAVVVKSAVVLQLLAGKDEALNVRWDAQSVLDFVLDLTNGAVGFNSNSYGLTREALHKNLPGVIDLFQLLYVQLRQLLFGRCFPLGPRYWKRPRCQPQPAIGYAAPLPRTRSVTKAP